MWAMKDELLGAAKAAELYGCSRANIYRLVEDGRLVPLMASPLVLRRADVVALSQANRDKRESSRPNPALQAKRKQLKGNSRSAAQLRRRAREGRERAELAMKDDIV